MANQFLTLSLFIMLLSFFIILNTMATYDVNKSSPVIRSLAVALSLREIEDNVAQSTIPIEEKELQEGSAIDKIRAAFNANISGFEATENRFGTEMYAQVPLKEFESALLSVEKDVFDENSSFDSAEGKFLPLLISVLQSGDTEMPYSMHMLINIPDNPGALMNTQPEALEVWVEKAAILSNLLEEAGLPKKLVSSGVEQGKEGMVSLMFRPYRPYSPVAQNNDTEGGESNGG